MRLLIAITLSLALSGCYWFKSSKQLPEPATDNGLSGAESKLDYLSNKRDSRVAAAIITAKGNTTDKVVTGELEVAEAMLLSPTPEDLAWAKARAEKGDYAFYTQQVAESRKLAQALIDANKKYELEKARKQAEFTARLAEKEADAKAAIEHLKQERLARINDWFVIGGGLLLVSGVGLLVAAPVPLLKRLGGAFIILGGLIGSIPFISNESWFKQAIGWTVGIIIISMFAWLFMSRKKEEAKEDVTSTTIN